jgi:hypothetical protein
VSIVIDCVKSPPVDAMRAAGVSGLCRYLSWLYRWGGVTHSYINPKIIQKPEFDALLAAGFAVALNWEYDPRDYLGGATAGGSHAQEAIRQARALGYPSGCVIIGSADTDVSRTDWLGTGRPYYTAFSAALRLAGYRAGIYGPWDVLTWAREDGVADVFWQAGMSTAWSGGRNAALWPGAHLRQRRSTFIGGYDCDINDIIKADYGQFGGAMAVATYDQQMTIFAGRIAQAFLRKDGKFRLPGSNDNWELNPDGSPKFDFEGADVPVLGWIKEIHDAVTALTAVTIDYDLLAQKVAALLLPAIGTVNSAVIVDAVKTAQREGTG